MADDVKPVTYSQDPRTGQRDIYPDSIDTLHIKDLAVTDAKIVNLSFNKAVGGTLTLGGSNNASGVFSLLNGSGSEVVHMDNTGIQVFNGNITIKNDSSQTAIDAKGIVSNSNNFQLFNFNGGPIQSITSNSQTDITGSSQTISIPRTTNVLFLLSTESFLVESAGDTADGKMGLNIDGTYPRCVIRMHSGADVLETRTNFFVGQLSGGSHTIKLQAQLETIFLGAPSMTLFTFSWTYILLGT